MRNLVFLLTYLVTTVLIFAASCGAVVLVVFLFDPYFASAPEEIAIPIMWIIACLIWIFFSLIALSKLRRMFFKPADAANSEPPAA